MMTLYQDNTKKITWNITFLVVFACTIVFATPDFPVFYTTISRKISYLILAAATVFFIHSIVLLPKYFNKQITTYRFWCIGCLLAFIIFEIFNFKDELARDYVRYSQNMIVFLVIIIVPIIVLVFTNYLYTALFLDKKGKLNFLEFFVNFIVVGFLLVFIISEGQPQAALVFLIVIAVFYFHAFYAVSLLTKYDKQKYYGTLLLLSVFYLVSVYACLNHPLHFNTSEDIVQFLFFLAGSLLLILFLSFIYGYFRIKIISKEKLFALKLGAKDSELQLLKSQVNPHFLFNTLNTLYATALEEKADRTAESTAKLASLIRYMQEDINKDFIPLDHEISYLKDYIAIQKLRCAVEPQIETQFTNIERHSISPGLLIPFVENAFKYGIDPSAPSSLKVSVVCNGNTISFECVNSYNEAFKTYYKEQGFGIGIANARQRLELVYPKKHTLEVLKENNIFSVSISIKTK
ncbi:sensor histidine kinase [Snuella lapsa]|uniref:Signal transduction histidine kinase internal region domain-containing protein n=1 Tax=Snuella lapsa TaxID=870481 RepID=A0ABP6WYI2_9FLAO